MPKARPFAGKDPATFPVVTGVDEVGRGPLLTALVTCALWFDPTQIAPDLLASLDDSKRISEPERVRIATRLKTDPAVRFALAASSTKRIEQLNIRGATLDAMRRAVLKLNRPDPVYVDGKDVPPGISQPAQAFVKGDQTVPQIAAASLLAKVTRDELVRRLDRRYPGYGWATNAGYGTAAHLLGLRDLGATPHHRALFVASALSKTPRGSS